MFRIPKTWQAELAAQRALRAEMNRLLHQRDVLQRTRDTILQHGGRGWAEALASANMAIDRLSRRIRVQHVALSYRTLPV